MRALLCKAFGPVADVVLEQVDPPPAPAADEVTIAVAHASVSHAVGLMIEGRYQTKPPFPFSPGTEAVGVVTARGERVTRLDIGDRVVAIARYGCYAERINVQESTVYPLPPGLDMLKALPIPISYGTAYCGLRWRCALEPGEDVLVLGAGAGVGLAAVELAALMGANVIACASTEAKRQEALRRGARHAVAPDDGLVAEVKRLTGGRGVDLVVDPVGGALAESTVRATAANARILSIGFASGAVPSFPANLLLVKNLTLHGFFFGRYIGWTPADERLRHAPALQGVMRTLMQWAAEGRIAPTVSQVFSMAPSQLASALKTLEDRRIVGKVALAIGDDAIAGAVAMPTAAPAPPP